MGHEGRVACGLRDLHLSKNARGLKRGGDRRDSTPDAHQVQRPAVGRGLFDRRSDIAAPVAVAHGIGIVPATRNWLPRYRRWLAGLVGLAGSKLPPGLGFGDQLGFGAGRWAVWFGQPGLSLSLSLSLSLGLGLAGPGDGFFGASSLPAVGGGLGLAAGFFGARGFPTGNFGLSGAAAASAWALRRASSARLASPAGGGGGAAGFSLSGGGFRSGRTWRRCGFWRLAGGRPGCWRRRHALPRHGRASAASACSWRWVASARAFARRDALGFGLSLATRAASSS